MSEGIADATIARAPESLLRDHYDLRTSQSSPVDRGIDIRRLRQIDIDGHAGATTARWRQDVTAKLRKFVVQHHFAAKQFNICVHDTLAIFGELMKRALAAERPLVESDRFESVLDANVRLDWRRIGSERHGRAPLQIQYQPRRILQAFLDADQERHRFLAVDDAVIIGQCQIHHRADLDLAGDRDRAVLYLVHAENGGLRRVQDRRRHQRTIDAAIGNGEGAALHLVDLELAVARAPSEIGDALFDLGDRFAIAVAHHRHHQTLVGANSDADVIVILVDQIGAVDLGVGGWNILQRLHAGFGEKAHEAQ